MDTSPRPKQIPGFYYDEVKRRYFRIAHAASGGQYTLSSISKRRRTEKLVAEEEKLASTRAKQVGTRKRLHLPNVQALVMSQELGSHRSSRQEMVQSGLFRNIPSRARLLEMAGQRAKIAYDSRSQTMYFASSRFVSSHCMARDAHQPIQSFAQQIYPLTPVAPLRSCASSLSFEPETGILLGTSVGEGNRPAELFLKTDHGSRIATVDGTLWCSALRSGQSQFAVAGSTVLLYDCNTGDTSRQVVRINGKTDVMSMEFLDTHVLALGCRNGALQLFDVRTAGDRPKTMSRFTHNSPKGLGISRVKALSRDQILISGLQSSLCLYDMRFMKEDRPLVVYRGHRNEYNLNINSLEVYNDMIVAAQESSGLGLWNVGGDFLGVKCTTGQVDDVQLNLIRGTDVESDTIYTMSQGLLNEWKMGS